MKYLFTFLILVLFIGSIHAQEVRLDQNKVNAIETLIKEKHLKFDYELDKAWVSPVVWNQYNVDGKESFTKLCALYIRYKQKDSKSTPVLDMYDYNSGKQIASYGPIRGFRIIN